MTKRKGIGAGKKRLPAHLVRMSKSVPLSGPKDPVKRSPPKAAEAPAKRRVAAAKKAEKLAEGPPSIFDAQMRLFQSMLRFSPLGYFMRAQELVRQGTAEPNERS